MAEWLQARTRNAEITGLGWLERGTRNADSALVPAPPRELPLAADGQEFSARAWLDGFLREQSRVRTALSLCQGALLDDFAQVVDEANANSMAASLVNPLPAFVSASLL